MHSCGAGVGGADVPHLRHAGHGGPTLFIYIYI